MPITATFDADIRPFSAALKTAEKDLDGFTGKATTSLDAVAAGMSKAGAAAKATTPEVTGLSTQYSEFDSLLRASGVNIGTQTKAVQELGKMFGVSSKAIGLIGPAAAAAGAAMAGWNIGRYIAEWAGLDKSIGDATAKMLGWGNVAGQVAMAQQDSINLAFRRTGIVAKDANEALALNTQWAKEHNAAAKESAAVNKEWQAAWTDLNTIGGTWQQTLKGINGDTVEAVKFYLEAGVAQNTLEKAYELTDFQVRAIKLSMDAATEATKAATQADKELTANKAKVVELVKAQTAAAMDLTAFTNQVNAAIVAEFEATQRLTGAHQADTSALGVYNATVQQLQASKAAGVPITAQLTEAENTYTKSLYDQAVAQDKLYFATLKTNEETAKVPALKAAAAGNAGGTGTPTVGYSVVGNSLIRSDLLNSVGTPSALGAGQQRVTAMPHVPNMMTINMNGLLLTSDPAARQQLAAAMSEAVTGGMRNQGIRMGGT